MKKITTLILVVFLLSACKKSTTPEVITPTTPEVVHKIKTIIMPFGIFTQTYDASGRLVTVTNTSNNSKFEYTYTSNTVTENYYVATILKSSLLHNLNADGLIIKSSYLLHPANNIPNTTNFTYNANKQRVSIIYSNTLNNNVTTYTNFYTNCSVDSAHTTYSNLNGISRHYYTYYTDKINTTNFKNRGTLFYAEESKMPIKKINTINNFNGVITTETTDYTYIFDTQNRITQSAGVTSNPGASIAPISYTYYE